MFLCDYILPDILYYLTIISSLNNFIRKSYETAFESYDFFVS